MQTRSRAFWALIFGAFCIAFAPILAKYAVNVDGLGSGLAANGEAEILSPVGVAFWRMLFAAPYFMFVAWRRTPPVELRAHLRGRSLLSLLLPGAFFAADLAMWHWSFEFTSVANATLLANLSVVIVVLISWRWLKESLTWQFVSGAVVAFAGMAGLVGFSFTQAGKAWIGDLMGLWVATMYAGYQISTKLLLRKTPINLLMAMVSISSCVVLLMLGAFFPGRMLPQMPMTWVTLIALAVVSQILGQGLIAFGMAFLPASFASIVLVLQPVLAALLGWVMLSQELSWSQGICGVVVLLGILLARRGALVAKPG